MVFSVFQRENFCEGPGLMSICVCTVNKNTFGLSFLFLIISSVM